jgi:hypothetical protein
MTTPKIVATAKLTINTSYYALMACTLCGEKRSLTTEEAAHLKKLSKRK